MLSRFSHAQLYATLWTVTCRAPLSMGFSRQEYWTGLPFPSLGDLPHPGIEPGSPVLQADSLLTELPGPETATDCPGRGQGPALRSGWPDVPVQLGEPGWVGSWGHGFGPHRDQGSVSFRIHQATTVAQW